MSPKALRVDLTRIGPEHPLYPDVIALGDRNRRSLGLLPHDAYRDYAENGRLLIATADRRDGSQRLLGYALYRLPRNEVVLAHLVVASDVRGGGIARKLVYELSERYAARRGILAQCRRDWAANSIWPRLGFVAWGERPGRGAKAMPLTLWWRDHGHPDLMTWVGAQGGSLPVVMDANIFFDLHADETASDVVTATKNILLRRLGDRVELLTTPELHNEIDRHADSRHRSRLHALANWYPRLAVPAGAVDHIADELRARARASHNPRDDSDLRHVAYASAAGLDIVITRDRPALKRLKGPAFDVAGVRLLSPSELVTRIDQLEDAAAYAPVALLGTGYSTVEAEPDDPRLAQFLMSPLGESRTSYEQTLATLAATRPASHRLFVIDPDGMPCALLGCRPCGDVLEVALLRLRTSALRATLATQLVHRLREMARMAEVNVLRLADPHLDPAFTEAATGDGYRHAPGGLVAVTLDRQATAHDLAATLDSIAERVGEAALSQTAAELRHCADDRVLERLAALEHHLRPASITDAPLPCFVVPIRQRWASELFGVPDQLFVRDAFLGISVEHVYYRATRPARESAPARLLWYASGRGPIPNALIGWSHLIEVVDDDADRLWRRFRRLGVYGRHDVAATADPLGRVRALRVADTELFKKHVRLDRYRVLAQGFGHSVSLQSPQRIPAELFGAIVREAQQ
ncbi:MAG TPA: GNAT family N-acetyltransferase [Frankiaceae bacterium]|nr:GNAT family N-acetyltransferase [Frankiaceae bacterium]